MFLSNFNYSILGDNSNSRIVFIHGLMAFSANWRKIASRLQSDFQCLIYDQRGHGRSFKPVSDYSPEVFAEDLNKITDELGWDHFYLVGHSMGGRNAMVFADMYPHKVKKLVIEDIGPEIDPQSYLYYENMLNRVPTPFKSKEDIKAYFRDDFEKNFKAKENIAVLSTFLQANIELVPEGSGKELYDWRFSKEAVFQIVKEGHTQDRWKEVKNFTMPVLLVRGENSHVLSSDVYEKMLKANPNIQGLEIKNAGHWVHFEKYEEFTAALREFLGKN